MKEGFWKRGIVARKIPKKEGGDKKPSRKESTGKRKKRDHLVDVPAWCGKESRAASPPCGGKKFEEEKPRPRAAPGGWQTWGRKKKKQMCFGEREGRRIYPAVAGVTGGRGAVMKPKFEKGGGVLELNQKRL